jgi:hypothetical protein
MTTLEQYDTNAAPAKSKGVTDLTGRVFGRLTVMSKAGIGPGRQGMWVCACSCGETCAVAHNNLMSGNSSSCGCFRREQLIANAKVKDITGQRFGMWLVTGRFDCIWADRFRQAQNQRVRAANKTGVRGVAIADKNRYRAGIQAFGKQIYLGYFPRTEEGLARAKAVRQLAEELYWEHPE